MSRLPETLVAVTCAAIARTRQRVGVVAVLSAVPVIALVALIADASAALPIVVRVGIMVAVCIGLPLSLLWLAAAWRRLAPAPDQGQRIAENALGDHHRHLTAAIQLSDMPGVLAARATTQMEQAFSLDALRAALPSARWHRSAAVGGCALVILLGIAVTMPRVVSAVVPRFLDPFGDHPPYSATSLQWIEAPVAVRPPQAPRFVVASQGPQPKELVLHVQDANDTPVVSVTMVPIGEHQFSATMAALEPAVMASLASPLTCWVSGGGTRTYYHRMEIDPIPQLTGGTIVHHSPSYSQLPPQKIQVTSSPATIQALAGSHLDVALTSNYPLAAVEVMYQGQALKPEKSGAAVGIQDPAPGTYEVVLVGSTGHRSAPLPLVTVQRRIDQPPTVYFEQPSSDGVATVGMTIPMIVRANDDLGLVRLSGYRIRNGERETESRHDIGGTSDTWRGQYTTDGLVPGDVLRLGVVATDTMPPDGQVSKPAERTIHIISDEDYNEMLRAQLDQHAMEQKYGDLLKQIADLEKQIAEQAKQPAGTPGRQEALDEAAKRAQELSAQIAAMQRPTPLFASEPDLQKALQDHLAALEEAARSGKQPPQAAEQAAKDLATMRALAEYQALLDELKELAKEQRQIANELADLKEQNSGNDAERARMRELARRQQVMEEAVREWQLIAKQVQEDLQDTHIEQARALGDLVHEMQRQSLDSHLNASTRNARANRRDDALKSADKAARILEALAASEQGQCKNCNGFGMGNGKGFGQCLSQLAGMAQRGYSRKRSLSARGGGATGAGGGGQLVQPGGNPDGRQKMQLFGPEVLTALQGGRAGQSNQQPGGDTVGNAEAGGHQATAYGTDTRATTAGVGASYSPAESKMIERYFQELEPEQTPPTPNIP